MPFLLLTIYIIVLLVRPQEWWEPLAGFELVNITAILTLLTTFVSQQRDDPTFSALPRNKFAKLMFGLLMAVVLSQLVRFRIRGASDAFTDFGKMVVLFSLTFVLTNSPRRVRVLMWVIVLCAALMSVHAYMQVKSGYGFGNIKPFGSFEAEDFRVKGTGLFNDPNDFAMLFLLATPFVFALLQARGMLLSKIALTLALPAFLYVLYYTKSRGAVVGFAVLLLAYIWVGKRVTLFRLVLTAALIALSVAFGPARARESVADLSAEGRIAAWGAGNYYLKQNPLFGIGYSRWADLESKAPHSSFVQCYAELGLVGYFFWFGLSWFVLRELLRLSRLGVALGGDVAVLARGLFASLAGYQASAFFLTHAYHPPLYFLLAMGAGLIRYAERQPNVPRDLLDLTARDLRWSAIFMLLSIPFIWLIIKAYWAGVGVGD